MFKEIILPIIAGILILWVLILSVGGHIYMKYGIWKSLFHNILGWHVPDESKSTKFDGCSVHCICKHCGKDIMQDSQGNWF